MTDRIDFETRLTARLAAHTADIVHPFDAAATSASVAATAPRRAWTRRTPVSSRLVLIGLVTLLALAVSAVVIGIGVDRGPRPLGDGERYLVWPEQRNDVREVAYVVDRGTVTAYQIPAGRRGRCPSLLDGTMVIDRTGFGGHELVDIASGEQVSKIPTRAGFERLSPSGAHLLIGDMNDHSRLGIVDLRDPATPTTRWFDAPGLTGADWSLEGDRVAFVTAVSGMTRIVLIDVATGETRTAYASQSPDVSGGWLDWVSRGSKVTIPHLTDDAVSSLEIVDTADGTSTSIPTLRGGGAVIWSPDGSRFALVTEASIDVVDALGGRIVRIADSRADGDVRWSSDGERLAFVVAGVLTVVRKDGTGRLERSIGQAPFVWEQGGSALVVATPMESGGITVDRFRADDLVLDERLESTDGERAFTPFCLASASPLDAH